MFFDYDGTVFLKGRLPEENKRAMEAAQALGHQVILNTGRSWGGYDRSKAENQGIQWDGYIFGGSDINYRGERIREHHISRGTAIAWVRYAMEAKTWVALEGEERNVRIWFDREENDLTLYGEAYVWEKILSYLEQTAITKLSVGRLDGNAPVTTENLVVHSTYAEVFPQGRDKGVAILEFCEHFGVKPEQCVCFGDSLNDLAMFETCTTSVCMSGAPEELKELATYCAKGEFGVAEGLKWLFGADLDLTNGEK